MKLLLVVLCLVSVCVCAPGHLENTYLPPGDSGSASGIGNFLKVPDVYQDPSYDGITIEAVDNRSNNQQQSGQSSPQIPILKYTNENNGEGAYHYEYETGNGIQAQEVGQLKNVGTDHESNSVEGSYSFTAPDGVTYTVTYTADENGFHAQGSHLPTPPPISDIILRSLKENAVEEDHHSGRQHYEDAPPVAVNKQYIEPQSPSFKDNSGYSY